MTDDVLIPSGDQLPTEPEPELADADTDDDEPDTYDEEE
jgi:hypothetical protein